MPYNYSIPETFRNKVFLFCMDTFSNKHNPYGSGNYLDTFWEEIHAMLRYRHGRLSLVPAAEYSNPGRASVIYLLSCKDEEFIDFIEYIFRVECLSHVTQNENELVEEINQLISSEGLGYELTDFVKERRIESTQFGDNQEVIVTVAWPQIIVKENQAMHSTAIKPVLVLLGDPGYKTANTEYLESLEDYRKEKWGDSLTKCCSSFESVMKIVCEKKKWKYSQSDTASPLIKTIIMKGGLESHYEQPLAYIAALRNKYSTAHGAGVKPKNVTKNIALLGINLTAAAILFLANEFKINK